MKNIIFNFIFQAQSTSN